jgi:hypothetical protein
MRVFLSLAALLTIASGESAAQTPPCCTITAIEAGTGLVSAKVTANGNVFQFKVATPAALASLRVGQGVYANFTTRQVSLNGRAACCAITSGPEAKAAAPASARPPTVQPAPVPAPAPPAAVSRAPAAVPGAVAPTRPAGPGLGGLTQWVLPTVSYGAPHPPSPSSPGRALGPLGRFESRPVTALVGGKNVTATVLNLRGLNAIEQAPGLSDGVRRLLEMHVRTIPRGESDHYLVNTQLAEEWVKAHPVPDYVQPVKEEKKDCDHWYDSYDCAEKAATDEWRRNWDKSVKAWDHVSHELNHDWNMAQGCFADQRLRLPNIPVQFDVTPEMTVHLEQSGSKDLGGGGSASGTVQGTVGLGFPMQSDFKAELDLFYIPCLPFVVRPRSLAGTGTLTVGERLKASVSATGKFDKVFTIPPTGGPKIILQVLPIVIGGVPVAELDISAYIEGNIEVGGQGKAEGHFQLDNPHKASFDFTCDGNGCKATSRGIPVQTTVSEGAEIQGQVFVKPAIYTALQLDFDVDALSARAGPQPYLLGTASGCAAVAGAQTVGGPSTSQENHVLAADLDWGVDLRAEALVLRKVVGQPFIYPVTGDKHLWFRDLAPGGSNALVAGVDGAAQVTAGKAAVYKVKMPSCYPYTNAVKYRVTWTGTAAPGANPQCQWLAGQGTCTFDPKKESPISLTWSAAGSQTLTVVPVSDAHLRTFTPAPTPTQLVITVVPAGGGGMP